MVLGFFPSAMPLDSPRVNPSSSSLLTLCSMTWCHGLQLPVGGGGGGDPGVDQGDAVGVKGLIKGGGQGLLEQAPGFRTETPIRLISVRARAMPFWYAALM